MFGREEDHVVMAVRGHLMDLRVPEAYSYVLLPTVAGCTCSHGVPRRGWHNVHPGELFDCPVFKSVREGHRDLVLDLKEESRKCDVSEAAEGSDDRGATIASSLQTLVLWLDCDREGENIAFEVAAVCCKAAPRLNVLRAKFSAVSPGAVHTALATLRPPDAALSDAVDARQEIDFRIGIAFTRWQTLALLKQLPHLSEDIQMLSYGPCQFPTLGFVVDRYRAIEAFVPEDFWSIDVVVPKPPDAAPDAPDTISLTWERGRLYDHLAATVLAEMCLAQPEATVVDMTAAPRSKLKPYPLATVELQKRASRWLRMSSDTCMRVAEKLYQAGYISYPRTETEKFPDDFDLEGHVQKQVGHPVWGGYAEGLLGPQGGFNEPRQGAKDDQAHPPIHPLKRATQQQLRSADEWALYEYITRHFLACCSEDARGAGSTVVMDIAQERFKATGLIVTQRNYLDVFRYERWTGNVLPLWEVGQVVRPLSIDLREGHTTPPSLLSEPELISLMDKEGIGTDATIAEHISTVLARKYVAKNDAGAFTPTTLGMALLKAYESQELPLGAPYLRAAMERDCAAIALGQKDRATVVRECLAEMKAVFDKVTEHADDMVQVLQELVPPPEGHVRGREGGGAGPAAAADPPAFMPQVVMACGGGACGGVMRLKRTRNGKFMVGCSGYPECRHTVWLPGAARHALVLPAAREQRCSRCAARGATVHRIELTLPRSMLPAPSPGEQRHEGPTGCVVICIACRDWPPQLEGHVQDNASSSTQSAVSRGLSAAAHGQGQVAMGVHDFNMGSAALMPARGGRGAQSAQAPPPHAASGAAAAGSGGRFLEAPAAPARGSQKRPRQGDSTGVPQGGAGGPSCKEHGEPCVVRTSHSATNPGRSFYSCPRNHGDGGCGFNGWADDGGSGGGGGGSAPLPTMAQSRLSSASSSGSSKHSRPDNGNKTVRKCGICRQPGHTRATCPRK